jgi:hypothetical protein
MPPTLGIEDILIQEATKGGVGLVTTLIYMFVAVKWLLPFVERQMDAGRADRKEERVQANSQEATQLSSMLGTVNEAFKSNQMMARAFAITARENQSTRHAVERFMGIRRSHKESQDIDPSMIEEPNHPTPVVVTPPRTRY